MKTLAGPTPGFDNNIKIDLREIGREGIDYIVLPQSMVQRLL
jgi:hypothetical protein